MRKALIITYYWPPSGGPGVQRILKFVKYLPEMGWEPHILTVKDGEFPAIDESLTKEIHPAARVYHVDTVEFFDVFRVLTGKKKGATIETYELVKDRQHLSFSDRLAQLVRNNIFLPDARVGWYLFSFRKSLDLARQVDPDIIFSSSPPHSLQLLARKLAQKLKKPWVADFRDPWTQSFYDKGTRRSWLAEKFNRSLEHRVVTSADTIISVSEGVLDLLGAGTNRRIIPNGYDEDDFQETSTPSGRFRIAYTGHMASVQNPENLFRAISALSPELKQHIQVDFYGSVDPVIRKTIASFNLGELIRLHGYVDHHTVTKVMLDSDLLLLLIPRTHARGILTGKLFEYLASGNFILGIGDKDGAAAEVVRSCEAGIMLGYESDPSSVIMAQYQRWSEGKKHVSNMKEVAKYSRKNLTRQLVETFEALCD